MYVLLLVCACALFKETSTLSFILGPPSRSRDLLCSSATTPVRAMPTSVAIGPRERVCSFDFRCCRYAQLPDPHSTCRCSCPHTFAQNRIDAVTSISHKSTPKYVCSTCMPINTFVSPRSPPSPGCLAMYFPVHSRCFAPI